VIHRSLSTAPSQPAWATLEHARGLVPAVLATAWDEQRQDDKAILASLSGTNYGTFAASMTVWSNAPDAPVQRAGNLVGKLVDVLRPVLVGRGDDFVGIYYLLSI